MRSGAPSARTMALFSSCYGSGGIVPPARERSLRTLTLAEREDISRGLASGSSIREIARGQQRTASTVSRRGGTHGWPCRVGCPVGAPRYAPFIVAAEIGLIVGGAAYVGELGEGQVRPAVTQILFVGSVYAGLGAAGLLIGYAWLGRLLGFVINEPEAN